MNRDKKQNEDQRLISEAQQSSAAFSVLYRKYEQAIFRFFKYRLGNAEDALDYMQETFLRAYTALKKFNYRGYSYLTYLLRIARNLLVDHYRRPTSLPLESAELVPDQTDRQQELKLDIDLLWIVARQLPPADQEVLELFYRYHKSVKEIAAELHQSQNAIKLRLSRARVKLRKLAIKTMPPAD